MIIYLKRLKSSMFVRVKAFPMYGGIGVSAPSLHRESTDSLIHTCTLVAQIYVVARMLWTKSVLGSRDDFQWAIILYI